MRRVSILCGLLILVGALGAISAPRVSTARVPAAASRPVPVVTVIKNDGVVIRGHLSGMDPDKVTIQPTATGKDATPGEVVVVWGDIKSVSNGMTRAKALEQWKAEHRESLCETCQGDRTVRCKVCKGTGKDPAGRKDCPTCKGELLVDCKTPRETGGKIPCPNHCLQLTEGQWTKNAEGMKIRTFYVGKGSAWFSEHHLGHVIVVDRKAGTAVDAGICPVCGGTTTIADPVCQGTGKVPCKTCIADKTAAACPANCDHGRQVCPTCGGTGLKKA